MPLQDKEHWRIEFWVTPNGVCLVDRDLLKKMRRKEGFLFASLEEKMSQYTHTPIEDVKRHEELEKVKTETHMWELKFHLPNCEVRFLGALVIESGVSVFYSLYAFKKKEQQIKSRHKNVARERIAFFISEHKTNGLQNLL